MTVMELAGKVRKGESVEVGTVTYSTNTDGELVLEQRGEKVTLGDLELAFLEYVILFSVVDDLGSRLQVVLPEEASEGS